MNGLEQYEDFDLTDLFHVFDAIPEMNSSLEEIDPTVLYTSLENAQPTMHTVNSSNGHIEKVHQAPGENQNNSCSSGSLDNNGQGPKSTASDLFGGSTNLAYERKRRKRLNEKLLSLRAVVPKITKMDKASIVSDAIAHIEELNTQIQKLEAEISAVQSNITGPNNISQSPHMDVEMQPAEKIFKLEQIQRHRNAVKTDFEILSLDLSKVEANKFLIRIACKEEAGVVLQLTRALELLQMEIINGHIISFDGRIITNVFAKMIEWETLKESKTRELIFRTLSKFGLKESQQVKG